MKHKFLVVLLAIVATLCMAFGFAACGEADQTNAAVVVASMEVDENGHLIVTMTDGSVKDLGKIAAESETPAEEEGTEGLQYQKRRDEEGNEYAAVVGLGTAWETDIVIPSTYRGLPVKEIGEYAFDGGDHNDVYRIEQISSVSIPDSVTSIGEYAFYGCYNLKEVHISDLEAWCKIEFEGNPFREAHSLYLNGEKITALEIPDDVTEIGTAAFEYCSGLTSVTIPDSVTEIGRYAFAGCSGLTAVTIPDGVTEIGAYAFNGCSGLTSVTIPDGVTEIGDCAFAGCSGLTSVTIPNSVTEIGSSAFAGCSGLTSVTIGSGVTSIGEGAFEGCSGLTSVTIPDSMTEIGAYAFHGCSGLTSVTIGSGVTSIGQYAFNGCSGLTSVTIPDSVTEIGAYAFHGCSGLTSVTIGSGVTSIGEWAFSGCDKLTTVTIPDSVTEIGYEAFAWCYNLEEIHFSNPNGWKVSRSDDMSGAETVFGLEDPAQAAKYLTDTYLYYYWKREG